jgi:hypothetical protein
MKVDDLEPWQALLDQLGSDVELHGLTFSEEGYCSLGLDTGRVLHLDVQADGLLLMTVLGEAPTGERRAPVLEMLLGANAFWVGTQGATLALDPALRQVLLMRKEPLQVLERRGLREVVGEIIATSERWAGTLKGADQPAEGGSGDADRSGDPMIRV